MPVKNSFARPEDERSAYLLSRRVSRFLLAALSESKFTQATFAREIGVSRVTLNQLLRSGIPDDGPQRQYAFRLPILCAVARVLNVSVPALLEASEAYARGDRVSLDELKKNVARLPFSRDLSERLRERIAYVLNMYFTFFPQKHAKSPLERADYESAYRCSVEEIEQGAENFWALYSVGLMQDSEVDEYLGKAVAYAESHGGLEKTPFWIALKSVFQTDRQ